MPRLSQTRLVAGDEMGKRQPYPSIGFREICEQLDNLPVISQVELSIGPCESHLDRVGFFRDDSEKVFIRQIIADGQYEVESLPGKQQFRRHSLVDSDISHFN